VVRKIVWTVRALADLREIHDYIARDSRRYAQIQVERLQDSALKLSRFPEVGRVVPEFPRGPWREILSGNYRLIYRVVAGEPRLLVLAVVHGHRLLKKSLIAPD
jgi:addiction module RelE/StbE family toxin